jgi:hypothetical protein
MIPIPVPVRRGSLPRETAYSLAILGGGLVLLQSVLFFASSSVLLIGLLLGASIIGLGAAASFRSRNREAVGALIVLLGLVSLAVGGGFYLGALLAIVGGILVARAPSFSTGRPTSSTFTAEALGPLCPKCGKHIPTWTAKCPCCGFPENE